MKRPPILVLAAALAAPGCAFTEPYDKPGTWRPAGAVEANIMAQLIRPSDYEYGVPYAPVSTAPLSGAVARWKADRVKPLPASAVSKIQSGGGDTGGLGAAAPTTGTGAATPGAGG